MFYMRFEGLIVLILFFNWALSKEVLPNDEKTPFELDEYLNGTFKNRGWNGTWVGDDIFLAKDVNGNVYKVIVSELRTEVFLPANVFKNFSGSSFVTNSNLKYALIRYNQKSIFRHSTTAQFTIYDIENGKYYHLADKKHLQLAKWSPAGSNLVYVLDNNIYYISSPENALQPIQITKDGVPGVIYNGVPDWVYEEEVLGSGSAVWFSPNGRRLAFAYFDDTGVPEFHYFLYGKPGALEDQYPTLVTLKYPKVGTPNPKVAIKYVNLDNPQTVHTLEDIIPVKYVTEDHVLKDVKWATDNDVVAVSLNRVQNVAALTRCNVETNDCSQAHTINETRGWLDIDTLVYNKDGSKYITISSEFEDDGSYKHLILVEPSANIKLKRLTFGKKVVLAVYGWDERRNLIYYSGTLVGDPAQQHVYALNTETLEDNCLTCNFSTPEGSCRYAMASFSKSFSYYARLCNGPGPYVIQVLNAETLNYFVWEDNAILREKLKKKLIPIKKSLKVPVEGGYQARVRLLLPPGLDETAAVKYPMIVNVYAGPNSNRVTDAFSLGVENYFVTNRKYIYVYIDGRGSGRSGDSVLFSIYRKLGTIEIEDQISVTKYLQERYPYIDASKTGIWGWSYGGFSTTWALIKDKKHVFSFGLAIAPVTSFIYYDSIYTERYMGLPTADDNMLGYNNTDAMREVEGIRNKNFLLIHGNADDNVHYQQSMMLSKALQRADILFYQQSYPDENHSIGGTSRHLYHTIDRFFDYSIRSTHPKKWKFAKSYKKVVKM